MTRHFTYCIIGAGLLLLPILGIAKGNKSKTNPSPVELQKANEDYSSGHYYEAINLYKQAYRVIRFDSVKFTRRARAEIVFKIGECYRQIYNPKMEVKWYTKAIIRKYSDSLTAAMYLKEAQAQMDTQYAERYRAGDWNNGYLKTKFEIEKVKKICDEKRNYRKGVFILCVDTNYVPMPKVKLWLWYSRKWPFPDPDVIADYTDGSGTCMMQPKKFFIKKDHLMLSDRAYKMAYHYHTELGDNYVFMHVVVKEENRPTNATVPQQKSGVRIVMHVEDKNQ